jgi:hypothetical protein
VKPLEVEYWKMSKKIPEAVSMPPRMERVSGSWAG